MNKPFIFTCICGNVFRRWKCHVRSDTQYCSRKCKSNDPIYREKQSITKQGSRNGMFGKTPYNLGKKMKAVAFCDNCSKTFFKKRSDLAHKNRHSKTRLCSRKCQAQWQKGKIMYGDVHPMLGKKQSKESIEKSRLANLGRKAWNKDVIGYMTKQGRINIGNARKTSKARAQVRQQRLHQVFPAKDSKPEIIMQKALKLNGIEFEKHKPIIGQPDIFIQPNNCIFVDGDYWHANPEKYNPNDVITRGRMAIEIWDKDNKINNELGKQNMRVYRFWESDIKKDVQSCVEKIKISLVN